MALQKTNIQTQNVQVFVDDLPMAFPTVPDNDIDAGSAKYVECVLELSSLKQTRATETYACMSSSASFTSAGTIEKDALTLKTLYSEDGGGNGGYDLIQAAFENNTQISVLIQFNNGATDYLAAGGGSGTGIWSDAIVTSFEMVFEKDKLIETNFELAYQGDVKVEPAV